MSAKKTLYGVAPKWATDGIKIWQDNGCPERDPESRGKRTWAKRTP